MVKLDFVRVNFYALGWSFAFHIVWQLLHWSGFSGRLFIPEIGTLFLGMVFGLIFGVVRKKFSEKISGIALVALQAELAYLASSGDASLFYLLLICIVIAGLCGVFLSLQASKLSSEAQKLADIFRIFPLMLAMLFGSTMSGGNTISTQLRSTSPDGVWATRVKRGGMLLGSQSDTVIVRPERDYLSVCMIRVARAPIRSVTKLSWEGRTLVVTTTEPFTVPLAPVSGVTILCRKP